MRQTIAVLSIITANVLSGQIKNDRLKINQLQVIGSHNSYKKAIEPAVYDYLSKKDADNSLHAIQYEHMPIIQQLDLGLRNLEIDVYSDQKGGRYAHPKMLTLVKINKDYDPDKKMEQPGFKMIHMPDVDFESWYYTIADCLEDLRKWSLAHPDHLPVFITLEPKEGSTNEFGTTPEPFTSEVFDRLDEEIIKNLGRDQLITPDMVRGNYKTLNGAILNGNWPNLKAARGKFLFILDKDGATRDRYLAGHPSLRGRVIFTNSDPGKPESAALILNDPQNSEIPKLVKQGYIIRTRADANTEEARRNDYSRFEAAKKSGAQIITTDYYLPGKLFPTTYQVDFGRNKYERLNPINGKN